jgi:hypothetical protein
MELLCIKFYLTPETGTGFYLGPQESGFENEPNKTKITSMEMIFSL